MFMSINSYQNLFDRLEDKFDACLADAAVHAMAGEDKVRVFLLRVNYVGIATFVVSCVVDAKAVMAERWKDDAERERDAIEHELADLDCLELDPQKARVLHSLMRQKVLYDIEREKHDRHAERKGKWLDEWSRRITQTIGVEGDGYFLDGKSLYDEINGTVGAGMANGSGSWLWSLSCSNPISLCMETTTRSIKALKPVRTTLATSSAKNRRSSRPRNCMVLAGA